MESTACSVSQETAISAVTDVIENTNYLNIQGKLSLKTRFGQNQFYHLLTFAKKVKVIYFAAKKDDPYADYYLIKIEEALCDAKKELDKSLAFHQFITANTAGLEVTLENKPIIVPLYFGTPFAYFAARLLLTLDETAQCILIKKHLGIPLNQPIKALLKEVSLPWRQALHVADSWYLTGVTRQDVRIPTSLGEQTLQQFGKLDARIIDRSHRSRLAPDIIFAANKNTI
jgi:integrating conjugative element protein (TIGR03761 family)